MTSHKRPHENTHKVLGTAKFGRNHLSFLDRPKPIPQSPTDVVVKVEYSDLNPVDHHKLGSKPEGTPTPAHRTPFIVGFGGSGLVETISPTADEATRQFLGKRVVFIVDPAKDGSYAQYVCVDRRLVATIPEIISLHEAACIPIAGCTALESLAKVGLPITSDTTSIDANAGEGKRLLIIGGAGGVGSWLTQLALSNYPKLDIVCSVGSPESADWCKEKMGCSQTVDHSEIKTLGSGPRGSCDAIICLTEPTPELFGSIAEVLRPYGKICLVVAGDGIKMLDLSFIFFKCGAVSTETVFSSIRDGYHLDQSEEMTAILELMQKGMARAPLSNEWSEAKSDWNESIKEGGYIDLVGSGNMKGKLVMKIGD